MASPQACLLYQLHVMLGAKSSCDAVLLFSMWGVCLRVIAAVIREGKKMPITIPP